METIKRDRWMTPGSVGITAATASTLLSGERVEVEEHPACVEFKTSRGVLTLWLDQGEWDWLART